MKIAELFARQGSVEVEGTIKEVTEPRIFNKYGRELKVADAILEDDSGAIKLTLWNDDTGKFMQGDKVKIINGYVGEYQGEKQLTSGKFGKIEKVGSGKSVTSNDDISAEEAEIGEGDMGEAGGEEDF